MASLGFASMSRRDLFKYRLLATKRREQPSVQNNYFTTAYSADLSNKQPADWVLTRLARLLCEHHGPANHVAAACPGVKWPKAKLAGESKADSKSQRGNSVGKATHKHHIAAKIQETRARQAAKRSSRATEGLVLVIRERLSQS